MSNISGPRLGEAWNHMTVIGCGPNRVCVIDRRDTRQCLKFMLPAEQRARAGLRQWMQRRHAARNPEHDENHAELRAWLQLSARLPIEDLQQHMATVLGAFSTIYGQALCCQRVTLDDGATAPSLHALLFDHPRYPEQVLCAAVDRFEHWLLLNRIPLFELNPSNLLAVPSEGGVRLVCVDAKSIVSGNGIMPLSRWLHPFARRKIKQRAQQLRERIRTALPN